MMINVKNVSKKLGSTQVLSDLSFDVAQGSTSALLGLSGSGKTTVLKLVCGLMLPDEGQIFIDDIVLGTSRLRELRKKMGYVLQDGGLFPHLTAFENISLVGEEAGLDKKFINSRIVELSNLTKISMDSLARYPRELSGGQMQRVGIMRALFLDPPILLLDEPFSALDPITRSQLQSEIKEIFQKMNKTVLLVTHDLFESGFLAGEIILLNNGKIAQKGSLHELIRNPANEFVKIFVNSQSHHIPESSK